MRRTKIVATLGPATSTPEMIQAVVEAGVDAARLNFSHGTREEQRSLYENVREVADQVGKPLPVIQDIQGPKIRVGDLPEGAVEIEEGDQVTFVPGEAAEPGAIPITYDGLASDVEVGDRILMDDGVYAAEVTGVDGQHVEARVVHGGTLVEHKGVNLPGVPLSVKPVQEKDRKDLAVGQDLGVDYVAASFVQSPADIAVVRSHISDETDVIAKIERREALANLEEIIDASDGILLARGDLGVELPPEEVPVVQKDLLWACHRRGTPSITATQMLESMIRNPRPTRAEASDVANAIFDGTGAVMLSGETATGNHPVEAVETMSRIAERAEGTRYGSDWTAARRQELAKRTVPDSIAHASCTVGEDLDVDAIITPTESGSTAGLMSKYRPSPPVLAVSPHPRTLRQLALYWGVVPLKCDEVETEAALMAEAERVAVESGLVEEGDQVVLTAGRVGHPGTTDHLRVSTVGELGDRDYGG